MALLQNKLLKIAIAEHKQALVQQVTLMMFGTKEIDILGTSTMT
jgi:hypothetical protein